MHKINANIGFAPAPRGGSCVVLSADPTPQGGLMVLETHEWRSKSFDEQIHFVLHLTEKYDVRRMAVDTTFLGEAVLDVLRRYFPEVKRADRGLVRMSDAYVCALDLQRPPTPGLASTRRGFA